MALGAEMGSCVMGEAPGVGRDIRDHVCALVPTEDTAVMLRSACCPLSVYILDHKTQRKFLKFLHDLK